MYKQSSYDRETLSAVAYGYLAFISTLLALSWLGWAWEFGIL